MEGHSPWHCDTQGHLAPGTWHLPSLDREVPPTVQACPTPTELSCGLKCSSIHEALLGPVVHTLCMGRPKRQTRGSVFNAEQLLVIRSEVHCPWGAILSQAVAQHDSREKNDSRGKRSREPHSMTVELNTAYVILSNCTFGATMTSLQT